MTPRIDHIASEIDAAHKAHLQHQRTDRGLILALVLIVGTLLGYGLWVLYGR